MKSKIVAATLLAGTASVIALFPLAKSTFATPQAPPPQQVLAPTPTSDRPRVEVVFVLDTTGSMSGLIQAAKEKIWSIATTLASANHAPEIRMGLVAYRDRGDAYVTRVVDLSSDLDSVYGTLMDFQADGGGDTPESVNQALHDAVHRISWSADQGTYRVLFLVGDAPPHTDYQDDVPFSRSVADARVRGIVVNTVQCGQLGTTTAAWRQIARLGEGEYLSVDQDGGAVAIATPFDAELASLSKTLDATRLFYGDAAKRERQQRKVEATAKLHLGASHAARARRAEYLATESAAEGLAADGDLAEALRAGRVDLVALPASELPPALQAVAPEAREEVVARTVEQRDALRAQIRDLARQRAEYVQRKVAESGGAASSLDQKLYDAVRGQAAKAGIVYESEAPRY
ncbi:MAG: VWA domain-containing protein [Ectothiorhodospiraceae bacterium]|nr:VWA domain-containing protein [Ectothiorhodospiraceae bacterium]